MIKYTLNPQWNEIFVLDVEIPEIKDAPPVILSLWDDDFIGETFLGITKVNVSARNTMDKSNTSFPVPKWREIRYGPAGCCFEFV